MTKHKLAVVSEWVHRADYITLKDHSAELTDDVVYEMNDTGYQSGYYAIVSLDENGYYEDTIKDDFRTAEEAWARYDELIKEK